MVLRYYLLIVGVLFAAFLILLGMGALIENEQDKLHNDGKITRERWKLIDKKLSNINNILAYIVGIILLCSIIINLIFLILIDILYWKIMIVIFLVGTVFAGIGASTEVFQGFFYTVWCISWLIYFGMMLLGAMNATYHEIESKIVSEKVQEIDILELKEIPSVHVEGRRYWIKSAPSMVYYYDITTLGGGTTTKFIDGHNNYVEKFEDDKYFENPHIDVYVVKKIWTNLYEREKEEISHYEYKIYIPKNGVYYEEKIE